MTIVLSFLVLTFSCYSYFAYAGALYRISRRRELDASWMAWLPLFQQWTLGNIADHDGRAGSKRKSFWRWGLLMLAMARDYLLCYSIVQMLSLTVVAALYGVFHWLGAESGEVGPTFQRDLATANICMILGCTLVVLHRLVKAWALYRVYRSCKPEKALRRALLSLIPFMPALQLHKLCAHDEGMPQQADPESLLPEI